MKTPRPRTSTLVALVAIAVIVQAALVTLGLLLVALGAPPVWTFAVIAALAALAIVALVLAA